MTSLQRFWQRDRPALMGLPSLILTAQENKGPQPLTLLAVHPMVHLMVTHPMVTMTDSMISILSGQCDGCSCSYPRLLISLLRTLPLAVLLSPHQTPTKDE